MFYAPTHNTTINSNQAKASLLYFRLLLHSFSTNSNPFATLTPNVFQLFKADSFLYPQIHF